MKTFSEQARIFPPALWVVPLILAIENTVVQQIAHPWFVIYLYRGIPIVFGLTLLFLGWPRLRSLDRGYFEFRVAYALMHLGAVASFSLLEIFLVRSESRGDAYVNQYAIRLWVLLIPVLVGTLITAFIPPRKVWSITKLLGSVWGYAALCSAAVVILREFLRLSWDIPSSYVGQILQNASFAQAKAMLGALYPVVVADPRTHVLGTNRFLVEVSGTCSGIEGVALISVFIVVWIVFARRELRIARALLLLPVAVILMWLLNLVRLVALIGIGNAGFERVAMNGFHSEAGWITLVLVSLAFVFLAQNLSWLRQDEILTAGSADVGSSGLRDQSRNVATIYLLPFLAITTAAIISHAFSADFEWLYPLRFIVALVVFWIYREEYRGIDWKFSTLGIVAGVVVAAIWLCGHYAVTGWNAINPQSAALVGELHRLPWGQRAAWISFRVMAASTTVPIAEELAFRGYVARRLVNVDVESISFSQLNVPAIAISSIAFGIMHGRMWAIGIAAGVVFALVARIRNRLGESIAAHATANILLAIFALVRTDYTLW